MSSTALEPPGIDEEVPPVSTSAFGTGRGHQADCS
jgi:hypothetical protein